MTREEDLTSYIFDGKPHALAGQLLAWVKASTRFFDFIDAYREKVRKKIRTAGAPDGYRDLSSELEVAYCLLKDRRFAVVYEPYASARVRGPDFGVTFRENVAFNIEVANIRSRLDEGESAGMARIEERIVRIVLDKLGQMQPGQPNLLAIHVDEAAAQAVTLDRLMQALKLRVEGRDPPFYAASPYSSPAAFYKDFLRLGAIVLWAAGGRVWVNKQARPGLDARALRAIEQMASGGCGAQEK